MTTPIFPSSERLTVGIESSASCTTFFVDAK